MLLYHAPLPTRFTLVEAQDVYAHGDSATLRHTRYTDGLMSSVITSF